MNLQIKYGVLACIGLVLSLFASLAEADSTAVGPMTLAPISQQEGYYLQSGSVELYCMNKGQPDSPPKQYDNYAKGWYNCSSPPITDVNGDPVLCEPGYAPNSVVSFAQADSCKGGNSTGGGIFMLSLHPSNGNLLWADGQNNQAYAICFNFGYARKIGNHSGGFGNTAIIINYAIFCRKCTPGTSCYSPISSCPRYKGPSTNNNDGTWPLNKSWGTGNGSSPWCNCTGSCPT